MTVLSMKTHPPSLRGTTALVVGLLMTCSTAMAVDGFAITAHCEAPEGTWGDIHAGRPQGERSKFPGKLMRYDVRDGKAIAKRVLYDKTDVGDVRLSPFGDRVAFVRPDGTILLVPAQGGDPAGVGRVSDPQNAQKPVDTMIYWPSSEGGKWIYYHDQRVKKQNVLRRVNLDTGKDEFVVRFNNVGGGDMTPNATPHSGYIVVRTDNYHVRVYDFAKGDGDLQHSPDYIPGCGLSCSPDSKLFISNNGWHTEAHLIDMNAQIRTGWRVSEFDGDPVKGITDRAKVGWAWQNFRWAANAMNLVTVQQGPLRIGGANHAVYQMDVWLYDWTNRKQYNLTCNPKGHVDRAGGFWEQGGKEGYLGSYRGKAPLTVEIADTRLENGTAWDFGDGSTARGAAAKHSYNEEGDHVIVARQGDRTYKAQVSVLKRKKPEATIIYVNSKCLTILFDEPVKAEKAQLQFTSGARVDHFELSETGTQLVVFLADEMKAKDQLTIKGIVDLAQVSNAIDSKPIPVLRPAWPSNRTALNFLWEDALTLNAVFDASKRRVKKCEPVRDRDVAGFGRYGRMYCGLMGLDGSIITGFYSQPPHVPSDMQDVVKAGTASIECVFQPAMVKQPPHKLENGQESPYPARIMQCGSWYDANWVFLVGQRGDKLQISVRTTENMMDANGNRITGGLSGMSPTYDVATLTDADPHHVVVTYRPGELAAYLDGKRVFRNAEVTGNFNNWNFGELSFGDNHNGGRHGWFGHVEGVALYGRALDAAEVAENYRYFARKIAARVSPPRLQVEARVTEVTAVPDPRRILPYTEALVVNEYEVLKLIRRAPKWRFSEKVAPGVRVRVAQWGLVPARFQAKKTWVANLELGDLRTLTLEVFKNNIDRLDPVVTSDDLKISDAPLLYEPRE